MPTDRQTKRLVIANELHELSTQIAPKPSDAFHDFRDRMNTVSGLLSQVGSELATATRQLLSLAALVQVRSDSYEGAPQALRRLRERLTATTREGSATEDQGRTAANHALQALGSAHSHVVTGQACTHENAARLVEISEALGGLGVLFLQIEDVVSDTIAPRVEQFAATNNTLVDCMGNGVEAMSAAETQIRRSAAHP